MRWQTLKRMHHSTIRAMQEVRLRYLVQKQLYPFSPHYRQLFDEHNIDPASIKTLDDLRRVPFTTKQDLLPTPDNPRKSIDFILQPKPDLSNFPTARRIGLTVRALAHGPLSLRPLSAGKANVKKRLVDEYKPIFVTSTTGRSAERVFFSYSAYDLANLRESGLRIFDTVQTDPDGKALNVFPYSPHLAFWQVHSGATAARVFAISTGGGKSLGTPGHLVLLERIQPTMIIGVPSYIYHLLRSAVDTGHKCASLQTIILGAEKVPPGLKKKMRELVVALGSKEDVDILGTYGFTEAKCAWAEPPIKPGADEDPRYLTYPDREIWEVVDPETGEPVGEGEDGEIVYTPLDARGSVVFRYRTGDLIKGGLVWRAPCPHSGATVPRLATTIGRVSSLSKIKGTTMNLDALAHTLAGDDEVDEWAVDVKKDNDDPFGLDVLILHVALKAGLTPSDELKQRISHSVATSVEVTPNKIEFHDLKTLTRMIGLEDQLKETRFRDLRPKP